MRALPPFAIAILLASMLPWSSSSAADSREGVKIKQWNDRSLNTVQVTALKAFHGPGPRTKNGPMRKVGYELTQLFYLDASSSPTATAELKANELADLPLRQTADSSQLILVDATASGDAHLLRSRLQQLGGEDLSVYGPIVSGWIPVRALDEVAATASLRFVRPSRTLPQTGSVTSQADFAIRGPIVRPPNTPNGPTGSGVSVGVISDSYNCLGGAASDVAGGELPNGVSVIREDPGCMSGTDEGRAMLQIVADVAPNASLLFASGNGGTAAFANAVTSLANSGADVIVDDLFYFSSPWFQDGVINAAIDDAVLDNGASYFSAAGNYSHLSYESSFTPSTVTGLNGGTVHDFDSSPGTERVLSSVFIPSGVTATVAMQWDQPSASACIGCPGSQSDIDVYFVDGTLSQIGTPGIDDNIDADPFELASFTNLGASATFYVVVERFSGPDPGLIKLIYANQNLSYEDNSVTSTSVGPGLAANAVAVGAAEFYQTPACDISPPQVAQFSSWGGVPTLFSTSGTRLSTPVVRQKPELVAPQNGNTSFFGQDIPGQPGSSARAECLDIDAFPNFAGTSAAAPHAAGVAALILDAIPSLTPQQLYDGMKSSAVDMTAISGFDFVTGFGLLQADAALERLADTAPDAFSFTPQTGVSPGIQVTSSTVTIAGTNTGAPVTVSGGEYSIACNATFTTAPGTIEPNQSVCVRHTASSAFNTTMTATLTIGGVSGAFASTTRTADTTPDAFGFTNQTGVEPNAQITSNFVTITGIEAPAPISVTAGLYSIGCAGVFTSNTSTISNGQTVCVRHTASSAFSTTTELTILRVGGVSATFTSTTRAAAPPSSQGGGGGGVIGLATLIPMLMLLWRRRSACKHATVAH